MRTFFVREARRSVAILIVFTLILRVRGSVFQGHEQLETTQGDHSVGHITRPAAPIISAGFFGTLGEWSEKLFNAGAKNDSAPNDSTLSTEEISQKNHAVQGSTSENTSEPGHESAEYVTAPFGEIPSSKSFPVMPWDKLITLPKSLLTKLLSQLADAVDEALLDDGHTKSTEALGESTEAAIGRMLDVFEPFKQSVLSLAGVIQPGANSSEVAKSEVPSKANGKANSTDDSSMSIEVSSEGHAAETNYEEELAWLVFTLKEKYRKQLHKGDNIEELCELLHETFNSTQLENETSVTDSYLASKMTAIRNQFKKIMKMTAEVICTGTNKMLLKKLVNSRESWIKSISKNMLRETIDKISKKKPLLRSILGLVVQAVLG